MIEFGIYLRSVREHAGLSLEDLHERTRISLKNLRLIESGDFPSIPQTYVRAFVREYARTVGLDEEEIIARYNEEAEREKGIPRPPAAIDSSNLLPKVDDSVEFVLPSDRSTSHVEVDGTAEVEADDFVLPVRKSAYVQDPDSATIDIRTTTAPETPAGQKTRTPAAATTPADRETPRERSPKVRRDDPAPAPSDPEKIPPPGPSQEAVPSTSPSRAPFTPAPPPPPPPPTAVPPRSDEKRMMGLGALVLLLVVIAGVGIYYFSTGDADESAAVDSTSIKASIEAGRFLDSSQFALTDIPVPEDTAPVPDIPPDPVEAKPKVFSREDSLVLEAFTSAPVWFSVKMDTLRTERGSLSSNEHRVWKARDFFVITLGDAGAVTFFLNGREIGALGEEGAVVKNVTLTRQSAGGN
ncbi:MAG: DUF4115 domain-containing protein [Bacteroidota bacterium]|jgi:transcriptional regulator with XRE-family HTH domain|nr:DUF4115 domain-containing protein [Bacteroidota bacterium]